MQQFDLLSLVDSTFYTFVAQWARAAESNDCICAGG